jgi:hypothetical protein
MSADERRTVVVASTGDRTLAHVWRGVLEAGGIPAFVSGEFMTGLYQGVPQIAAVTVHVFEDDAERARALLEEWLAETRGAGEPDPGEGEQGSPDEADREGGRLGDE